MFFCGNICDTGALTEEMIVGMIDGNGELVLTDVGIFDIDVIGGILKSVLGLLL